MKKVVKRIAVMLVTIIMLLFVLTSCDLMVSDILSFLNIKSKSKQLSELGIGYAYNLIENEAYDVTKISSNKVFDIEKLLEIGSYDISDAEKAIFESYSYSSSKDDIYKGSANLNFEVGVDYKIGNVKANVNGDLERVKENYTYNYTCVVRGDIQSKVHMVRDIEDEMLKETLSSGFIKDIESLKNGKMTLDKFYQKYGTHAILGVVTGGTYTAQYIASTNNKKSYENMTTSFEVSTENDITKILELDIKFGGKENQSDSSISKDVVTTFSVSSKGSTQVLSNDLSKLEESLKSFETGVAKKSVPINFSNAGAVPISELIKAVGDEYIDIADDYNTLINIKSYKTYKECLEYYKLPIEFEKDGEENLLVFDFSDLQTVGSLSEIRNSSFAESVVRIDAKLVENIDKIVLRGGLNYSGDSNLIDDFSIKFDKKWNRSIDVIVDNLGVILPNGAPLVDRSEVGNKYNINVKFVGDNIVKNDSNVLYYKEDSQTPITIVLSEGDKTGTLDLTKQDFPSILHEYSDKYVCDGLFTSSSGGTQIVDKEWNLVRNASYENITVLYPHWTQVKDTISFDLDGGSMTEKSVDIFIGEKYGNLPTPTKEGYVFVGWYLNGQKITPETIVTVISDHTLNAKWLKVQEKVTRYFKATIIEGGDSINVEFHPGFDNNALINMGYTTFALEFSIVAKGASNTFDYAGDQPIVYVCSCYSDNAKNNHIYKKKMQSFENDDFETQKFSATINISDTLNGAFWIKVENSDEGKGVFNPSYPLYIKSITVVYIATK